MIHVDLYEITVKHQWHVFDIISCNIHLLLYLYLVLLQQQPVPVPRPRNRTSNCGPSSTSSEHIPEDEEDIYTDNHSTSEAPKVSPKKVTFGETIPIESPQPRAKLTTSPVLTRGMVGSPLPNEHEIAQREKVVFQVSFVITFYVYSETYLKYGYFR